MRGSGFAPMIDVTQAVRSPSALVSWEQRSDVAILAEAEQCHIEQRPLRIERLASVKTLQGFPVQFRGFFGRPGSRQNRVNLGWRNGHMVNEGFPRHPEIAVGMVGGHKTFVTPEKMNFPPIE